jgi:hypothetical protein
LPSPGIDRHADPDPNFGRRGHVAIRFGSGKRYDAGATSLTLRGGVVYAAGFVAAHGSETPPSRFGLLRYDGVAKRREG